MSRFAFLGVSLTKRVVVLALVTTAAVVGAGFGYVLPALDGPNAASDSPVETTQEVASPATEVTTDAGPPTADETQRATETDDTGPDEETATRKSTPSATAETGPTESDGPAESDDGSPSSDRDDRSDDRDQPTTRDESSDDASMVVRAESNATVSSRPAVGPARSAVLSVQSTVFPVLSGPAAVQSAEE